MPAREIFAALTATVFGDALAIYLMHLLHAPRWSVWLLAVALWFLISESLWRATDEWGDRDE
jgi:hypothetical protein